MSLSIFAAAEAAPERLALIAGSEHLTFRELARKVEARLATLQAQGVLDGARTRPVAVLATPSLASIETVLALLAAGTPALLLHPRSTPAEREVLVQRASAVAEPAHAPAGAPFAGPLAPFDPERIAVLVPTSGTTGSPRLARLSHRALLAAARASADHLGVEDDRWLLALPLAHVGGLMTVVRSLVARTAVVAFDPEGSLLANLPRLRSAIQDNAVTLLSLVPAVLERLLAAPEPWQPPASLRAVLVGGAGCPAALLERASRARVPVLTTYGMTETCAQIATRRYGSRWDAPATAAALAPSGVALPNVELRLGADGVVEVRTPALFSGYAGEPASDPGDGWFTTRDRGSFTPDGELTISGRSSDVIVTGGENVDPVEVEALLATLPFVRAACVLGVPEPTFGELVTALLVVDPDGPTSLEAVVEPLRARLSPFKLPRKILVVPELPLLPTGKLDRRSARLRYLPS